MTDLGLSVGEVLWRRDVHAKFGGQTQSGISPSSSEPVVMLFSNPPAGEEHGYFDGWHDDLYFHYSGEGQRGDQEMKRGNKRVRDHAADNRSLHLFLGEGKNRPVTYAGEFMYVDHYETDAPETAGGPLRRVYMFRLRPVGDALTPAAGAGLSGVAEPLPESTVVSDVATERQNTEAFFLDRSQQEASTAERRESSLVKSYERFSLGGGRRLARKRIAVANELKPLFCDLFDDASNTLIEAKGSVTREAVRMAIGQLFDYRRFISPPPSLALLVPELPRKDLVDFAHACGVDVIYANGDAFETASAPSRLCGSAT